MESLEPEVECLICVWKAPIMLSTWVGSLGEFISMIIIMMCSENNEVGVKNNFVCKFDNTDKNSDWKTYLWLVKIRSENMAFRSHVLFPVVFADV